MNTLLFLSSLGAVVVLATGIVIGACVVALAVTPAIALRDEAISLAIEQIPEVPDPIFGGMRDGVARFYEIVREIPRRWVPPSTIVVRR